MAIQLKFITKNNVYILVFHNVAGELHKLVFKNHDRLQEYVKSFLLTTRTDYEVEIADEME